MADVVRVEGPDAAAYLQGQLSQDVEAMPVAATAWTFVLEPTGHVVALAEVRRDGDDAFSLRVDSGHGEAVEARLRKFLLRTKATVALERGGAADDDERARIESGRPGPADIDERTVPAETGWIERAVSFTKGCYTGQELVARMDSRVAEPPRRLVRITVTGAGVGPGAPIEVDGTEVGAVTSAAGSVAMGYVKRGTRREGDALVAGVPAVIEGPAGA